ncbi:rhamnogalacturonan acetylesterase [Draconibacterium sp. IB214405]|uniref:rhamnogalacturonan acetylesterase n=1 Tax=Draconibacterium sp. IB214405 TaxID=3097352 RepID=UPI002A10375F|nr:rhamnogalacturonan acetylesterase [Draconibacterium sp. IB214405]MDX8338923.1 rhamnogalacturonan acetylesterase [Draconibacterium sp. IB214405]
MRPLLYFAAVILLFLSACDQPKELSIYCVGDSTMANKSKDAFPETGWCMVLDEFFNERVSVENHAKNGRSSKSFIDEGRWQTVLDSLQPGDYVFIQFGHNDEKDYDSTRYTTPFGTYTENLTKFVTESREKGAIPVLFTSIVRRKFDENGKLTDTHGDYPVATRQVAELQDVPLIDLQELTEEWVNSLGDEASKQMYVWTDITNESHPEPRKDDTHLSQKGAHEVARLATTALDNPVPALAKRLK